MGGERERETEKERKGEFLSTIMECFQSMGPTDNPGRGNRLQIPAMICLFGGGIEERTALGDTHFRLHIAMPGEGEKQEAV